MGEAGYSSWIGRSETKRDEATLAALRGLAALLDYECERWGSGPIPPLAHWLYFLPTVPQSELGEDGHPKRGGFYPPVALPRRMWAAGRLNFLAPINAGDQLERVSTIKSVTEKAGASGPLVFVTVAHRISANGQSAIEEEQDIVYRGASANAALAASQPRSAERERTLTPNAPLLFRYSALTFNAHRIHYDLPYATQEEGYPGLVVQGPLIATLLMDHYLRAAPPPRRFSFRAERPLIAGQDATLCAAGDELWCRNAGGDTAMRARVERS